MTRHRIAASLLARFECAAETLVKKAADRISSDTTVGQETRDWLKGKDEPPLPWQNPRGMTPDEYFFITTLFGNMNPGGQRTLIRRFFEPLLVQGAQRDIRNFRPEMTGYEGLRSPWMKRRLCRTQTHIYLTGNYFNPDGCQGVQVFVWPKA